MPAQYAVGQVLPSGATVTSDSLVTAPDGTTIETMRATYPSGAHDDTAITIPGPNTPAANSQSLQQKAQNALVNNATFLAIGSPSQAQAVAQVQTLTRQVNALIRMTLNQYDTTAGT